MVQPASVLTVAQRLTLCRGKLRRNNKDVAMKRMRSIPVSLLVIAAFAGCEQPPQPYGREQPLYLYAPTRPLWAVAPAVNLSGEPQVDPLLQGDLLYQQLQSVHNITVIPVNRVVEVFAALHIAKVESEEQARLVCQQLGCDALVVPTVTAYDPYDPPKVGAALQLLGGGGPLVKQPNVDLRTLERAVTPPAPTAVLPAHPDFLQSVGMFDSANGSVRDAVLNYAAGRNDPAGPMGSKEYFVSMDRYCGFVYHALIVDLLSQVQLRQDNVTAPQSVAAVN
jgi:hypothetical protein